MGKPPAHYFYPPLIVLAVICALRGTVCSSQHRWAFVLTDPLDGMNLLLIYYP